MIIITPNTNVQTPVGVPICFEASGNVVIPQEDERYIDLPASGTNWTYNSTSGSWQKSGGSIDSADAPTYSASGPFGFQPFYVVGTNWVFTTPGSPNRKYACYVGVVDDNVLFYGWYLWKNCGAQSIFDCGGPNGDDSVANWKAYCVDGGVTVNPIPQGVNFREEFRVRSDGTFLNWDYKTNGVWRLSVYKRPLPETEVFKFHLNSLYPGNEVSFVRTFKATFQGNVPLTWSTPLGGTLTGDGSIRCFSSGVAGLYQVCVDSEFDDPVCVDIEVATLHFQPVGIECGNCVFTGEVVHFQSNAGYTGTLTATAGTIIDNLTWQAPGIPQAVTVYYTLDEVELSCLINVIDRPIVINVVGDTITGLVPGESFQILTNYDPDDPEEIKPIQWESIDCPNIVSESGLITIPISPLDPCFGALDCVIRGRLVSALGDIVCANKLPGGANEFYIDLRVIVDPIFPTTLFGGPKPRKWKPETPDYRVIINEFEGGCDETYLRNQVAIYRWTVTYAGIPYDLDDPCGPQECCDEDLGFIGGFHPRYQVAKRIDDFWNLVAGEYGYFTLIDYLTGEVWKRVRFDGKIERDHINWRRTQSRTLRMVWHPCCAVAPKGGVCQHNTTFEDNISPSVPQNLQAEAQSGYKIFVSWEASTDNVGIKGYQLDANGIVIDVGNVLGYYHTGLQPGVSYSYQVRAYDFSNNFSAWSGEVLEETSTVDTTPPTTPTGFFAEELLDPSLLNLRVWYKASTLDYGDNGAVPLFTDLSGNAKHAITTGASGDPPHFVIDTPTLNYAESVRFLPGQGLYSPLNLQTDDSYIIYMVLELVPQGVTFNGILTEPESNWLLISGPTGSVALGIEGHTCAVTPEGFVEADTAYLIKIRMTNTETRMFINGVDYTVDEGLHMHPPNLLIGHGLGVSNPYDFYLAELICTEGLLGVEEDQELESYLKGTYNIDYV